jgi:hypothetical protein
MEANQAETAEPTTTRTAPSRAAKQVVDKYAEARLAKKKARRRAHRKTIARSNTNG